MVGRPFLAVLGALLGAALSGSLAGAMFFAIYPAKVSNDGFWDVLAPVYIFGAIGGVAALALGLRLTIGRGGAARSARASRRQGDP